MIMMTIVMMLMTMMLLLLLLPGDDLPHHAVAAHPGHRGACGAGLSASSETDLAL
jgi:hypothetical protein